jgi:hypothetical protein
LCPLRLHIQIDPEQNDCGQSQEHSEDNQEESSEPLHPETLRRPTLKKRSKPLGTSK